MKLFHRFSPSLWKVMPFGRRIELHYMIRWVESMFLSSSTTKHTPIGTIRNSNKLSSKLIYLMQVVLA